MRTLKHLFLDELADRYDAEKRLVIAMPKMIKAATCTHLQKLIQSHLKETERHVKTLEKVFRSFGEKPRLNKCEATIGLLKEGDEVASDNLQPGRTGWDFFLRALGAAKIDVGVACPEWCRAGLQAMRGAGSASKRKRGQCVGVRRIVIPWPRSVPSRNKQKEHGDRFGRGESCGKNGADVGAASRCTCK